MKKICPMCSTLTEDLLQCPNCQLIFSKYEAAENLKRKILLNKEKPLSTLHQDSARVRAASFPIVFLLALISANSFLGFIFLYFKIWIHEFGHAIMSWVSGIKATPISFWGFGMTFSSSEEKSFFVFASFNFLMGFLYLLGKRERALFLSYLSVSFIVISIIATWLTPFSKTEELIIWAGMGGEFILGTLLVISFYYRLPQKWYWEHFFRWPALFMGFFTLISLTKEWLIAFELKSLKPFGANSAENAIMGVPGDLYRLMNDHGWKLNDVLNSYLALSFFCWLLISGYYIWGRYLRK